MKYVWTDGVATAQSNTLISKFEEDPRYRRLEGRELLVHRLRTARFSWIDQAWIALLAMVLNALLEAVR